MLLEMQILQIVVLICALISLGLTSTVLKNDHFECSFEDLECSISNLTKFRVNDQLNTTLLGNRTHEIHTIQFLESILPKFPMNLFTQFSSLRRLMADNCFMVELNINQPADVLDALLLQQNLITALSATTFSQAKQLKSIDLSYNQIVTIEETTFNGLVHLETIWLSNNRLRQLMPNTFQHQAKLFSIRLDHNQLLSLNDSLFQATPDLTELWLNSNSISSLPSDRLFEKTRKLDTLKLDGNQLSVLSENIFGNLGYLSNLDLSFNNLTSVKLTKNPNLTVLSLDHNKIQEFDSRLWPSGGLENLSLAHNHFRNISRLMLANMRSLKFLNLSSVNLTITALQNGLLANLTNLEQLDLSLNKLEDFYVSTLEPMKSLKRLDLSGSIPDELVERLNHMILEKFPKLHLNFDANDHHPRFIPFGFGPILEEKRFVQTDEKPEVSLKPTKPDNRVLDTLIKLQAENQIANAKVWKWLVLQSCLLSIVGFYVLLKLISLIIRTFRNGSIGFRPTHRYMSNDDFSL